MALFVNWVIIRELPLFPNLCQADFVEESMSQYCLISSPMTQIVKEEETKAEGKTTLGPTNQ